MKINKISILLLICVALSSCHVTRWHSETVKTLEVEGEGIRRLPVLADLSIESSKDSAIFIGQVNEIEDLKNQSIAKILSNHKADILIEPHFIIDVKGNKASVTAYGFPATYRNFRAFKKEDMDIFKDSCKSK
jgi:hypothetical protein